MFGIGYSKLWYGYFVVVVSLSFVHHDVQKLTLITFFLSEETSKAGLGK